MNNFVKALGFSKISISQPRLATTQKHPSTMLQKRSKCEVKTWLCWNLIIFPPLPFCMKSKFGEFKRSKMSFLVILKVLNFDFGQFEQFFKSQIGQNSKFRVSKITKMAIFEIQILPKLISRKIEWQMNFWIYNLYQSPNLQNPHFWP